MASGREIDLQTKMLPLYSYFDYSLKHNHKK